MKTCNTISGRTGSTVNIGSKKNKKHDHHILVSQRFTFEDNTALFQALKENQDVIPLFIFDTNILEELPRDDARVTFIYEQLEELNSTIE